MRSQQKDLKKTLTRVGGDGEEDPDCFFSTENNKFKRVDNPYHKVHNTCIETEEDSKLEIEDDLVVTISLNELQKITREAFYLGLRAGKGEDSA